MGNGEIKNCYGKNSYQSNLILSVCILSNTHGRAKKTNIFLYQTPFKALLYMLDHISSSQQL